MGKIKLDMSGVLVGINIPSTIVFEIIETQLKSVLVKNYKLLKTVKYYIISNSHLEKAKIEEIEKIIEELTNLKPYKDIENKKIEKNSSEKKGSVGYKIHYGNLRSGEKINCTKNLVILGSLNPGSYVKCKNNIFVYGKARGTLHAGSENSKNQNSYIYLEQAENPKIKIGSKMIFYEKKNTKNLFFQKKINEISVREIEKNEIIKIMKEIGISTI